MKKLILFIFILNLNLTQSLANDINDFEIGPISLGQSLLDYVQKNKIESIKSEDQYPNDKYIRYESQKLYLSNAMIL